jgi:hypothetical protein
MRRGAGDEALHPSANSVSGPHSERARRLGPTHAPLGHTTTGGAMAWVPQSLSSNPLITSRLSEHGREGRRGWLWAAGGSQVAQVHVRSGVGPGLARVASSVFRSRRSPERFVATILFTDIVGSTDLAVRLGAGELADLGLHDRLGQQADALAQDVDVAVGLTLRSVSSRVMLSSATVVSLLS